MARLRPIFDLRLIKYRFFIALSASCMVASTAWSTELSSDAVLRMIKARDSALDNIILKYEETTRAEIDLSETVRSEAMAQIKYGATNSGNTGGRVTEIPAPFMADTVRSNTLTIRLPDITIRSDTIVQPLDAYMGPGKMFSNRQVENRAFATNRTGILTTMSSFNDDGWTSLLDSRPPVRGGALGRELQRIRMYCGAGYGSMLTKLDTIEQHGSLIVLNGEGTYGSEPAARFKLSIDPTHYIVRKAEVRIGDESLVQIIQTTCDGLLNDSGMAFALPKESKWVRYRVEKDKPDITLDDYKVSFISIRTNVTDAEYSSSTEMPVSNGLVHDLGGKSTVAPKAKKATTPLRRFPFALVIFNAVFVVALLVYAILARRRERKAE